MESILSTLLDNIYFLIIAVGLSSGLGDVFINQYAKNGGLHWFVAGCVSWIVSAAFFAYVLKKQLFAPGVALYFLVNLSMALLIGKFYFGDRPSPIQWFGVAIGVVAMFFIVKGGR